MTEPRPGDETRKATMAFEAHQRGDPQGTAELLALVYGRLRALAQRYMAEERRDHTLQPTALVHEAYVRLIDADRRLQMNGKTHFYALAASEMRRVLVDHARAHAAVKRGGRAHRVTLYDHAAVTDGPSMDLLALDEALSGLASKYSRQAKVAELRLFAGLQILEIVKVVKVSERTVKSDWRMARAWLARELRGGTASGPSLA